MIIHQSGVEVIATIHTDRPVVAVAWSQDGSKIASINYYGEVDVWLPTGKLLRHLGRVAGPTTSHDLGFVDHGRHLVTPPNALIPGMDVLSPGPEPVKERPSGREKEAFAIWDIDTGRVVRHVEGPPLDPGNFIASPGRYAVSPDGAFVALWPPLEKHLSIYETSDWKIVQTIDGPPWHFDGKPAPPTNFIFSPDSQRIAISGDDEIISYRLRPYGSSDADEIHYSFPGSSNPIFSPDAILFATDGAMQSEVSHSPYTPTQFPYRIRFWRLSDQALLANYPERFEKVRQVSWSPDGEIFAVSANDAIRLYRPRQPSIAPRVIRKEDALSLAFSPRENVLAAAIGAEISIMKIER